MIENMTGVLAPRAGGLAAHRTTTTRGAFDEILKEIRGGSSGSGGLAGLLSGSLGGAGSSNSGGGLTSWLAGFTKQDAQGQTPIDKAIAGIAPQVTKALNDMGPAMTHLLTAAAPLIPTMVNLADAAPKVIDNLAPIVKGFSVTANVLSKVLDNKGAVDVLEGVAGALLLYKGLSTVISVIKGVYSTIHDAQTIFSADGLKGLLGKTVTTTTMEVAANVVNVIGGGVGAGGPGSLLNDVEAAGAGAGLGTLGFLGLAGAIAGGITVGGPELFGGKHNIQKKGILSGSGQDLVDFSNWVGSGLNDALSVFGLGTHKKPVAAAAGPGFAGASGTASGAVTINQTITVPGTANHATISAGVDKANRDAQDSYARARNNRG
jgi:hypothetical protein